MPSLSQLSRGYPIVSTTDGETGIRFALQEKPELIICDIQLPRMNGYEVVRELKRHPLLNHIPVLAVTAYAMVGDRENLLASDFNGYISKPITPKTFVEEVERFINVEAQSKVLPQPDTTHVVQINGISLTNSILVVDDSIVNLELIRSTLEPSGYKLFLARSVSEAFSILRQRVPDLILSDLHMGAVTGVDFLSALKQDEALRKIPFLIITASFTGEKERQLCMGLGAEGFIVRPIEPMALWPR